MPKIGNSLRSVAALALIGALAALAAGTANAAPSRHAATTLQGAGSTLIAPAFATWSPAYGKARGVEVSYSGIGSGGGIAAITARTVDFGCSDAPLSPDQLAAAKGVVQIPWALTATVPSYNIPGVADTKLRLSGPVLADIYLGHITKWNDAAIRKLNPGLKLPDLTITPIHRSDGSGDTFAFTDYLSKVSPEWASKVGNNTSVNWPAGVGGKGNPGVAALIGSTPGSIGYVSDAYVLQNHIAKAQLLNRAGRYTLPSVASIEAAAQTVTRVPADNRMSIVDPPASKKYADAYPTSTFTYIIVPLQTAKAHDIKNFVTWALTHGQPMIRRLVFAPIPRVVLVAANRTLAKVHS
ncbi:MAG: phosphate ABC transporter substrate-binding protein PstS [Chloroflexota bacterium]|nr:phosphate ABC transporter substrate-binding protein PstS [Chloroflexota bacterium]